MTRVPEPELLRRLEVAVRAYRGTVSPDDDLPDPARLLEDIKGALRALDAHRANPVHWCDQGQQPDIHVECSDTWDTPVFDNPSEGVFAVVSKGVYRLSGGLLYTFDGWRVTCPNCLNIRPQKSLEQEYEDVVARWSSDLERLGLLSVALITTEQAFDRLSYKLDLLTSTLRECTRSSGDIGDEVEAAKRAITTDRISREAKVDGNQG